MCLAAHNPSPKSCIYWPSHPQPLRGSSSELSEGRLLGFSQWSEVAQSCPTLCHPMDSSLSGSSVHGIFQARITGVSCHFLLQEIFPIQGSNPGLHIVGRRFTIWATQSLVSPQIKLKLIALILYSFFSRQFISSLVAVFIISQFSKMDPNWDSLGQVMSNSLWPHKLQWAGLRSFLGTQGENLHPCLSWL